MGKSPLIKVKSDLVNCNIVIGGNEVKKFEDKKIFLYSVEVFQGINRISTAEIEILDGTLHSDEKPLGTGYNILEEKFSNLKPGEDVEIYAGYHQDVELIFKGIIVRTGIKLKDRRHSVTYIECADKAVKMTTSRFSEYYLEKKDSDIIAEVVGKYEVGYEEKSATEVTHKEIVQYYSSDWDFIVSRAEANGKVILAEDNVVKLVEPTKGGGTPLKVTFGLDFNKADMYLNGQTQLKTVKSHAWNMSDQKIISEKSTGKPDQMDTHQCDSALDGVVLAPKFAMDPHEIHLTGPLEEAELKAWADARLTKSRLSRVRGRIMFQGNSTIKMNDFIEIAKTGKFFDGDAYVAGINHTIRRGNWLTEVQIGMPDNWFVDIKPYVQTAPASALLPGIEGLYNGVVKQMHDDPDGEYRVLVDVPVIKESGDGIWARVAKFYASVGIGSYFMPEVGDEVILGFLQNDPRFPIILGSVYSSKHKIPKDHEDSQIEPDEENSIKAIVTNSELKIVFQEVDKKIIIRTPNDNRITLNDLDKEILIEDQHNNFIKMYNSGIDIESPRGDINIVAKAGKITIDGKTGVNVKSAANIDINATGSLTAKGSTTTVEGTASATLKSGGVTTVKGNAMVKIN